MNTSSLTFDILPSNVAAPIGVEVWFDDQKIIDIDQVTAIQNVKCEFNDDDDRRHFLKIVVKNKTAAHTQVSESGEITSDSVLDIKNFMIDEIDSTLIIQQKAVYSHDFNGTGTPINDNFFDTVGCNGTVTFEFSSPVYLWLLENM